MITWMQRHKKWLVITIWISTFAFVGAGFVGWGSYDYSSTSGAVGKVGSKKIKMKDIQTEYNNLYTQYQKAFGAAFNKEMAKQFRLEEAAFNGVVQKFLLLNYADDLGLYITDEEVAKYLVTIPAFIKDNKFDKNIYLSVLKQNRTTPLDFEEQIRQDLLIQKVQKIFNTKIMKKELTNIATLYSSEDQVSINIINKSDFIVDTSTDKIKAYWEQHKADYKTPQLTKISISTVNIDDDRKQSKKNALKKYLKLKKDELKFDDEKTIAQEDDVIIAENILKIAKAKVGKVLKPIENNGTFIIVKVLEKIAPQPLSFDKAFDLVKVDYIAEQKQQLLNDKIKQLKANFTGTNIGFIQEGADVKIDGLEKTEVAKLLSHIVNSQSQINSYILGDKAVVYKIVNSKFTSYSQSMQNATLKQTLLRLKNNEIITNLLKQLQNKYEVISNMKVK